MKAQKVFLNIEPQDIDDFSVIAIHSNLEAYLLAYRLNQNLGCLLHNTKKKSLDDIFNKTLLNLTICEGIFITLLSFL